MEIKTGVVVDRKELLSVLSSLPVERKGALPMLSKVIITSNEGGLELKATDLETYGVAEVSAEVNEQVHACVDGKTLINILRNIDDDRVEIVSDENRVEIGYEDGAFKLDLFHVEDFPEFPAIEEITAELKMPIRSFIEGIESVIYAASKEEARLAFQGVYIHRVDDKIHFVASDGHRLALHRIDTDQETDFSALIPARSLKFVKSALENEEGDLTLQKTENFTIVKTERFTFYIRELESEFPDYLAVIPKEEDITCKAEVPPFDKTLKRFISAGAIAVKITISEGEDEMWISFEEDEVAGEEAITLPYAEGSIEIGFNAKYLYDFVSRYKHGLKFKFTSPDTAAVLESEADGTLYVVMPMRL